MRAIRLASAAMLGVSALALTACTTAVARGGEAGAGHSGFSYNLEPAAVAPGGRVNLPVRGCNQDAKVFSGAFDDVTIPRGRNSATVTVGRNALPGTTFDVLFQCGHQAGHRQLVMTAGRNDRDEESQDEGSGRENGRGEAERPQHGVHAGEGGSIGGFDLKKTGLGAALVLVSVGAAWQLTRRRGRGSTS